MYSVKSIGLHHQRTLNQLIETFNTVHKRILHVVQQHEYTHKTNSIQ